MTSSEPRSTQQQQLWRQQAQLAAAPSPFVILRLKQRDAYDVEVIRQHGVDVAHGVGTSQRGGDNPLDDFEPLLGVELQVFAGEARRKSVQAYARR